MNPKLHQQLFDDVFATLFNHGYETAPICKSAQIKGMMAGGTLGCLRFDERGESMVRLSVALGMLVALVLGVVLFAAQSTGDPNYSNADPAAFKKIVADKQGQLLDVRTPEEYAEGFISGATNLNFFDEGFQTELEKLDKSKPVYVYCRSGGRSGKTMERLKGMGFAKVVNLAGGMIAWQKDGMPVEKPQKP